MKRKILYASAGLAALACVLSPTESKAMFPAFDGTLFGARVEQAVVMIKEGYEFYEQGRTLVDQSIAMGTYIKEGDWNKAFGALGNSLNSLAGMGVDVINIKNAINNTQNKVKEVQQAAEDIQSGKALDDLKQAGVGYANDAINKGLAAAATSIDSAIAESKEKMLGDEKETQAQKEQRLAEIDEETTDVITESFAYAQTAQQSASESPQKTEQLSQQVAGSTDMATDLQNSADVAIYQAEVLNSGNETRARMLQMMSIQAVRARASAS